MSKRRRAKTSESRGSPRNCAEKPVSTHQGCPTFRLPGPHCVGPHVPPARSHDRCGATGRAVRRVRGVSGRASSCGRSAPSRTDLHLPRIAKGTGLFPRGLPAFGSQPGNHPPPHPPNVIEGFLAKAGGLKTRTPSPSSWALAASVGPNVRALLTLERPALPGGVRPREASGPDPCPHHLLHGSHLRAPQSSSARARDPCTATARSSRG